MEDADANAAECPHFEVGQTLRHRPAAFDRKRDLVRSERTRSRFAHRRFLLGLKRPKAPVTSQPEIHPRA